jgi:hypothetical protein
VRFAVTSVAAVLLVAPQIAAGDDTDVIPQGVLDETPATAPSAPSSSHWKLFLEDAFTLSAYDDVVVSFPSGQASARQNRTSFDARLGWKPLESLSFTLSDRLSLSFEDQRSFFSRNTLRNDFREGYLTWRPSPNLYVEAGRINVRNGAALGYNPTDFFKTRTLMGQSSLDPSVIRQNRLGTVMLRGEAIWSGGSASLAVAPKLASASPVVESDPMGLDPHFGATNAGARVLATVGFDAFDLSPQLLGYVEDGRAKVGVNLTRAIGDAVVVYAEWAGGPEKNLITRAIALGRETGTLPDMAPPVPPTSDATAFRNDVAGGLSWTLAAKVTLNAEYHFHQAGLSSDDWRSWFDLGAAPGAPPALVGELWFLRAYANDAQEPLSQHQLFVRASWPRAFGPELELTAFAFVDLVDGSVLSQVSANEYLSSRWTASVYVSSNLGPARSERGSSPQRVSSIFQLTLFL